MGTWQLKQHLLALASPSGRLDISGFFDDRTGRQLTHGARPVVPRPPHTQGGRSQEGYVLALQIASSPPGRNPETRRPALYTSAWPEGRGVSPGDRLRFWVTEMMDRHSRTDTQTGGTAKSSFASWLENESSSLPPSPSSPARRQTHPPACQPGWGHRGYTKHTSF